MMTSIARGIGRTGGRIALILLVAAVVGGVTYALSVSPASSAIQGALSGGRGGQGGPGGAASSGAPNQQGAGTQQAPGARGGRPADNGGGRPAGAGAAQGGGQPGGGGGRNQISLARGGPELARNLGVVALLTAVVVIAQSVQRTLRVRRRRIAAA